ncbi:MAG: hypothetical protein U0531_03695 [Dehalococcoidia bacterium]
MAVATLAGALALAFVHLIAARLRFLDVVPRSRWLSAAGGIAVAYVFLHLLPELVVAQDAVSERVAGPLIYLENHVYLVALLGLAIFYGLERAARGARGRRRQEGAEDRLSSGVFVLHLASFALYNTLIGYLLVHRVDQRPPALALFVVAMALHFVVTDFGLRDHYRQGYQRVGRWALMAAVLAGWTLGRLTAISEAALALLLAFLAGGVILNVLKEELPEEQESRFWAFAVGAAGYALLLQII